MFDWRKEAPYQHTVQHYTECYTLWTKSELMFKRLRNTSQQFKMKLFTFIGLNFAQRFLTENQIQISKNTQLSFGSNLSNIIEAN